MFNQSEVVLIFIFFWICRVRQWIVFFWVGLENDFWNFEWFLTFLIIGDVYFCHIFVMRRCKFVPSWFFFLNFWWRKFRFWDFFELLNGLIRNRKRGRIIVNQIEFSITTFINLFNPHFKKWYFRNCIFLSRSWSVSEFQNYCIYRFIQ